MAKKVLDRLDGANRHVGSSLWREVLRDVLPQRIGMIYRLARRNANVMRPQSGGAPVNPGGLGQG